MPKTVVLGLDGSDESVRAIPWATDVAGDGGRVVVVHVQEMVLSTGSGHAMTGRMGADEIEADVRRRAKEMNAAEVKVIAAAAGTPAHVLADVAAEQGADLIVVGTRGRHHVTGLLLGGVTNRLLHIAPCAVLAVPPAAAKRDAEAEAANGAGSTTPAPR